MRDNLEHQADDILIGYTWAINILSGGASILFGLLMIVVVAVVMAIV